MVRVSARPQRLTRAPFITGGTFPSARESTNPFLPRSTRIQPNFSPNFTPVKKINDIKDIAMKKIAKRKTRMNA